MQNVQSASIGCCCVLRRWEFEDKCFWRGLSLIQEINLDIHLWEFRFSSNMATINISWFYDAYNASDFYHMLLKSFQNSHKFQFLRLFWFFKTVWSIWWWIQNDNLYVVYEMHISKKHSHLYMWMMFAVRDGRLCTERIRKINSMIVFRGLQFVSGVKTFSHFIFIMLSEPSLEALLCRCEVIPYWVSFTYFPYSIPDPLFTFL